MIMSIGLERVLPGSMNIHSGCIIKLVHGPIGFLATLLIYQGDSVPVVISKMFCRSGNGYMLLQFMTIQMIRLGCIKMAYYRIRIHSAGMGLYPKMGLLHCG